MAQVELETVCMDYPGTGRVLDRLCLTVREGELLVLVGPSGCGKSTLLRIVAGLERQTEGHVRIGGRSMKGVAPADREVAMVFQGYALYPHLTARRNIAAALRGRGLTRREIGDRVEQAAASLALGDCLDRKPAALSGGQRQRVAIARVLARRPAVFLLDEPLSNLDLRARIAARAEIRALHRRLGSTTIHVTHDQEEAMTLGDRIAIIGDGRIRQVAPPLDAFRSPADRHVAELIGSPPMNFIAGRLSLGPGGTRFHETGTIAPPDPGGDADEVLLHAPAEQGAALAPHAGPVVVGVRPGHIRPGQSGGVPIRLTPINLEHAGDHILLHTRTRVGSTVLVRLDRTDPPDLGSEAMFSIEPGGLHWFEPGPAGRNLLTTTA